MCYLSFFSVGLIVNKNGNSHIEGAQEAKTNLPQNNAQNLYVWWKEKVSKAPEPIKNVYFSLKCRDGSFHSQESVSVGQKSQGIFANRAQGLNDQRKRHAIIFIVNCDQFRRRGGGGWKAGIQVHILI